MATTARRATMAMMVATEILPSSSASTIFDVSASVDGADGPVGAVLVGTAELCCCAVLLDCSAVQCYAPVLLGSTAVWCCCAILLNCAAEPCCLAVLVCCFAVICSVVILRCTMMCGCTL